MPEELSRLKPIELRCIWATEDQHFTPWLAEEDNLALLSETLRIDLELEGQEINVGDFRADILCRDIEEDSRVLIENQLEETDHDHLGKILTYSAGLDAYTVIWIAKQFRDEHRAALDRLNEITDDHFQYFGIEIKVWQIGDSTPAPQFDVVSSPNDWSRTVSRDAQSAVSRNLSEIQLLRKKFWEEFGQYLTDNNYRFSIRNPRPTTQIGFGIGKAGFTLYTSLLTQAQTIRVRLTMRGNNAKIHFHKFRDRREEIEEELSHSLRWEELPDKEASWIALDKDNIDPTNEQDWPNQHKWLASKLELFDKVFRPRIKDLSAADWEPPEDEDDE